jgi:hypothetical protein
MKILRKILVHLFLGIVIIVSPCDTSDPAGQNFYFFRRDCNFS